MNKQLNLRNKKVLAMSALRISFNFDDFRKKKVIIRTSGVPKIDSKFLIKKKTEIFQEFWQILISKVKMFIYNFS